VKYSFITQHKNTWSIILKCQVLGVKRSAYYAFQKHHKVDEMHLDMLYWVKNIGRSSGYTYGSRRIKEVLNALGFPVGRDKTRSLMKEADVRVRHRKKYKATTNSNHKLPLFDNLVKRDFDVQQQTRFMLEI